MICCWRCLGDRKRRVSFSCRTKVSPWPWFPLGPDRNISTKHFWSFTVKWRHSICPKQQKQIQTYVKRKKIQPGKKRKISRKWLHISQSDIIQVSSSPEILNWSQDNIYTLDTWLSSGNHFWWVHADAFSLAATVKTWLYKGVFSNLFGIIGGTAGGQWETIYNKMCVLMT